LAVGFADSVLGAAPCPPTLDGTQPVPCPRPVGSAQWTWNLPSLQDETDFYNNVLGWTIPSNADSFTDLGNGGYTWSASSSYRFGNVHGDTEGDALWMWYHHRQRYGNVSVGSGSTTQDWVDDLTAYFNNNLLSELDSDDGDGAPSGFGFDHMYGQGVAAIYNATGNSGALAVLDGLRTRIEGRSQYRSLVSRNPIPVSYYLARGVARWAIAAAYAAEATGDPAWETVRDNLAWGFENASDWEEGGNIVQGGCFFASAEQAGYDGIGSYGSGRRYQSTFSLGLAVEAMWRMFIQTNSSILRERLISIARYVQYYAHDPAWVGPNVGDRFGHNGDGSRFHTSGRDSGNVNRAATDCSYDISLVNTMVIGYKLTGEQAMLDVAHKLFSRGNRWDPGASGTLWAQSINHVHKYVDTQCDPSRTEAQFNKGALQYCYLVFENGGNPGVLT